MCQDSYIVLYFYIFNINWSGSRGVECRAATDTSTVLKRPPCLNKFDLTWYEFGWFKSSNLHVLPTSDGSGDKGHWSVKKPGVTKTWESTINIYIIILSYIGMSLRASYQIISPSERDLITCWNFNRTQIAVLEANFKGAQFERAVWV